MTTDALVSDVSGVGQTQTAERERFTRLSAAIVFLIFFQTYMLAPLIPFLASGFGVSPARIALVIPAYTLPYAAAGLILGAISDRLGRRAILFASLVGFPMLSACCALAASVEGLIVARVVSGLCNAGIVVMAITLIADLYPDKGRARALGWVFGAIAGGGAFGSTAAGLLAPVIGWRGLFLLTAAASLTVLPLFVSLWTVTQPKSRERLPWRSILPGFVSLARNGRAMTTYAFIAANATFHSGVFTWLGFLLHGRYGLSERGIGLALLGYGVPGFLFGPLIGRVVDRYGRRHIIPAGFAVASLCAAMLALHLPLWVAMAAVTGLSLGFDLTHPLLAGIAAGLDNQRRGQAIGVNTFSIFLGLGVGSLAFGVLAPLGLGPALLVFASLQAGAGVLSKRAFSND